MGTRSPHSLPKESSEPWQPWPAWLNTRFGKRGPRLPSRPPSHLRLSSEPWQLLELTCVVEPVESRYHHPADARVVVRLLIRPHLPCKTPSRVWWGSTICVGVHEPVCAYSVQRDSQAQTDCMGGPGSHLGQNLDSQIQRKWVYSFLFQESLSPQTVSGLASHLESSLVFECLCCLVTYEEHPSGERAHDEHGGDEQQHRHDAVDWLLHLRTPALRKKGELEAEAITSNFM